MKVIVCILLLCFSIIIPHQNFAQRSSNVTIEDLLSKADSLSINNNLSVASEKVLEAMEITIKIDLNKWYRLFGKYRKLKYKCGEVRDLLDRIDNWCFDIDESESEIIGKLYYYSGFYHSKLGNGKEAIYSFKESINNFIIVLASDDSISKFLVYAYEGLALNYSRIGDQDSAIKFIENAIHLIEKMKDQKRMCSLQLNFSRFLFYKGDYQGSKNKLYECSNYCKSDYDKSILNNYLTEIFIVEDSIEMADKYISVQNTNMEEYDIGYLSNLAMIYRKRGFYLDSKHYYKRVIKLLEIKGSERALIKKLIQFGRYLFENQEEDEAFKYAHKALRIYYPDLDSTDYFDRSIISNTQPDVWIVNAMSLKIKCLINLYARSPNRFIYQEITYYLDQITKHFDSIRLDQYSTDSKYRMGQIALDHYSQAISFFVDLYQIDNNLEYLNRAFDLTQKGNAFVLRNAVSERKILHLADVSQDSLELYLDYVFKTSEGLNKDTIYNANILLEYDSFRNSLCLNYLLLSKTKANSNMLVEEVRKLLENKSLLVKYYFNDDLLTIIGISKNKTFAENIPFGEEEQALINTTLEYVSQEKKNDTLASIYMRDSKKLYDLVLGDLLKKYKVKGIDHILIVPDGPLKKVSFSSLVIKDSPKGNDPNNYLISKYALNYLYYCAQLRNNEKKKDPKKSFIGFGIEYSDAFLKEITKDFLSNFKDSNPGTRALALGALEHADDEATSLAQIFGGQSIVNSEVTKSKIVSAIDEFDVVHISAHAFVDNEDYLNSYVVLNKDDKDEFRLSYSDILNLNIDNELVVLSACQTSNGESVVGEGLMSLSRAFVQSGSNSTVGSYWNAPDYATKELMTLFYNNLKKGLPKSKALQNAQIEYLNNDDISSPAIRSPFFWASWTIYGNDLPIEFTKPFFSSTSMIVIMLTALFGILFIFMYKVSNINKG